ncbi:MAG: hypothetical protein N4A46_03420 [Schleiferiaceae bacterium]|jgi:hypothetical protein|nr:hypothetical protein [Schleiferiaceae bacterium]
MSKEKWQHNMDEWLNNAMDDLPTPEVASWDDFDAKRKTGYQKRGLVWFTSILALMLVGSLSWNYLPMLEEKELPIYTPREKANEFIENKTENTLEQESFAANKDLVNAKEEKTNTAAFEKQPKTETEVTTPKLSYSGEAVAVQSSAEVSLRDTNGTVNANQNNAQKVAANWEVNETTLDGFSTFKESDIPKKPLLDYPEGSLRVQMRNSEELILPEGLFEDDKLSVTLSMYPNYTFRDLSVLGANYNKVHKDYLTIVDQSEKGGVAINIGADVKYKVGKDVFVGSGLYYIQTKITGAYNFEITEDPVVDPETGNIIGYEPAPEGTYVNQGILNTFNYLQVPLVISYQPWLNRRLRMVVEGGTSYLRFLNAQGTTIDYQTLRPVDLKNLEYNKNLMTLNFKIGVNYYLTKQLALGVEPTFLYFNNSIFGSDHPIYMVPWSIGVNFSLKVRLR